MSIDKAEAQTQKENAMNDTMLTLANKHNLTIIKTFAPGRGTIVQYNVWNNANDELLHTTKHHADLMKWLRALTS
jgi:hypothetical protein